MNRRTQRCDEVRMMAVKRAALCTEANSCEYWQSFVRK